ncbi:MAG: hypothetical protein HY258_09795 [Chloroflexi bacterium]|nr:hypothetical protein [Chloroflexota bacterium]
MQLKKIVWLMAALVIAVSLTSCNIGKAPEPTQDVNAIYTAAAETTIAQFSAQQTQTAQALPPTPLPSPTALPTLTPPPTFPVSGGTPFTFNTPGAFTPIASQAPAGNTSGSFPVGCNDATFTGETIPDKTEMKSSEVFNKSWNFINSGTCTWDSGYAFAFKSGDRLQGDDFRFIYEKDFVKPGKGIAFIIEMTAPIKKGEYVGYWQMKAKDGTWFGSLVSVDIVVK